MPVIANPFKKATTLFPLLLTAALVGTGAIFGVGGVTGVFTMAGAVLLIAVLTILLGVRTRTVEAV